MELNTAEKQKAFSAEKQISYVRAIIIAFGSFAFFFLDNPFIKEDLAYILIVLLWLYGAFVLYHKPYEKYPIFLASWFTYITDCIFVMVWIYATGGFYSPYHVILYTSVIAVAFRFDLKTTLITSTIYTVSYFFLLHFMGQLEGNLGLATVRTGFIYIIGFLTYLITKETLTQTQQKIVMEKLVEETREAHKLLSDSQVALNKLNEDLKLKNKIFNHAEENVGMGTYAWNLRTGELQYSDNLFRLLGHKPGDFVPSFEKFVSFIHPDDRERVSKEGMKVFEEKTVLATTYRLLINGKTKHIRTTGSTVYDGGDEVLVGTVQDISSDIRLQEQLRDKNMDLEQINHQLSSFNYIASHDLQEPVRKIKTFTSIILAKSNGELSSNTRTYLSRINAAANSMQKLVMDFLTYSKLNSSETNFEMADLNSIFEDVKKELANEIKENNVTIESEELPALSIVRVQFHQLFQNLIGNSIKYRKKDVPLKIIVKAEKVKGRHLERRDAIRDMEYWKISFRDNGIGFEPQYSEKIFEVFQRLHSKDKYEGTGIGLAICKKVALTHRGFITASGVPGEGALFVIYIPVDDERNY